jgi:DNA-binding NtrC family response regulator
MNHNFLKNRADLNKILIVDDLIDWWGPFQKGLERDYRFAAFPFRKNMTSQLKREDYECVLLGFKLNRPESFNVLKQIRRLNPHTPVIGVSDVQEPNLIDKANKEGVFDFLIKPFLKEKLKLSIERGIENLYLKNQMDYMKRQEDVVYDFGRIVAESPVMKRTLETLKKFARTDSNILVTGETGTGKSFLSGAVHYNSIRRERPFVKINCANLPENLLESELFGHEKGAFTGADKLRIGRLEQARSGTVFLDEIGEMSLSLQAKLLRVLEDKKFERLGGNKTIHSDIRIIAATNRQLESLVERKAFREDLFYRLDVLRVQLPPLRDRTECIEPLAKFLLGKICRNLKKDVRSFDPEVMAAFESYSWPGNIRQMANTIERAVILTEESVVRLYHVSLPPDRMKEASARKTLSEDKPVERKTVPKSLEEMEKESIVEALEASLWIQKDAAKKLGISPRGLNYKIKKYGIRHHRWKKYK